MKSDTIKLVTSHVVAAIMAIGGPVTLIFVWMQPVDAAKEGLMAILGGLTTMGAQFLFQTNTQSAARAQTRNDLMTETPSGK